MKVSAKNKTHMSIGSELGHIKSSIIVSVLVHLANVFANVGAVVAPLHKLNFILRASPLVFGSDILCVI